MTQDKLSLAQRVENLELLVACGLDLARFNYTDMQRLRLRSPALCIAEFIAACGTSGVLGDLQVGAR